MANLEPRRNAKGRVTSWRVRWRTHKVDGRWRWDSESFNRRAEAIAFMAKVEAAGNRRPDDAPRANVNGLSVPALVNRYIDDRARRVRNERSIVMYRSNLRLHIEPTFADHGAVDLTRQQVQDWADTLPLAPKTVANVEGLLSAAYRWGIQRDLVTRNPCEGVELPRDVRKTKRGLRAGEWAILYQAAVDTDPDTADFLLFLVGTGWRWSEASALQVMDCHLDGDAPMVEVTRVHRTLNNGRVESVDDAKSTAGLRPVRLSPRIAQMLTRKVTGRGLGDLVFPGRDGRAMTYISFYKTRWRPVVALARTRGLTVEPTPHWLRHTQVALALDAGASLAAVQKRLGHEKIATTIDTYGRLVDEVPADVLERMDDALFGRVSNVRSVTSS